MEVKIKVDKILWFGYQDTTNILINTSQLTSEQYYKLNYHKFKKPFLFHNLINNKEFTSKKDFIDKINKMELELNNIEEIIFNFNFMKIYKVDHIDKIKFVYQYFSFKFNGKKDMLFKNKLSEDSIILEQFCLTKNRDKYDKGKVRIFHLFLKEIGYKDDAIDEKENIVNYTLYPLFIDANHSICINENKIKEELLNPDDFYDSDILKI